MADSSDLAALLDGDRFLTPGEVAAVFRVDPKTVTRWAAAGKLHSVRTLGGHRRFRASVVKALLAQTETKAPLAATDTDVDVEAELGITLPVPAKPVQGSLTPGR